MTDDDLLALNEASDVELAHFWCELNAWKWPKEIPEPERPHSASTRTRRGLIMDWIMKKIGHKKCLWYWNTRYRTDKDRMTPEQFERWYTRSGAE